MKKVFKGYVCKSFLLSDLKNLKSIDDHVCLTKRCAELAWRFNVVKNPVDTELWPPKRATVTVEVED
jgi:hypothetical protein